MRLFVRLPGPFGVILGSGSGKRSRSGFAEFIWWMLVLTFVLAALVSLLCLLVVLWIIEAGRWLANRRLAKRGLSPIPRAMAVQRLFDWLFPTRSDSDGSTGSDSTEGHV